MLYRHWFSQIYGTEHFTPIGSDIPPEPGDIEFPPTQIIQSGIIEITSPVGCIAAGHYRRTDV